jgi:ribosomal protein S1
MLLEGQCINGEVENLSLKGAFIVAGEKLKMNQVVSITIDDPIACDIRAKVVRVTDKGIGLEFEKNLLD